jgi:hypothetical protein
MEENNTKLKIFVIIYLLFVVALIIITNIGFFGFIFNTESVVFKNMLIYGLIGSIIFIGIPYGFLKAYLLKK